MVVFFFKQKTAYEMRISDWSSDVCSSDLAAHGIRHDPGQDRSLHLCGGRAGRTGEGPQRGLSGSTYRCGCAGRLSREAVYAHCRLKGSEPHMKRRLAALVALASMTKAITAPFLAAPPPFSTVAHISNLQALSSA